MIYREIPIQMKNSSHASLVLYLQDYSADMLVQNRPMVILCPGGGYNHISVRESESEALQFLAMAAMRRCFVILCVRNTLYSLRSLPMP